MGVPRLGRWFMERFPYAVRTARPDTHKNLIQNLYIDFNGLIHESLVRSAYIPLPTTETELFNLIINYLDTIVKTASPTRTVFIAVDGPAPDAKIAQQRLRRVFGAITSDSQKQYRENIAQFQEFWQQIIDEQKAMKEDGSVSDFSTTQITPGTCFMSRLQSLLVIHLASIIENNSWGNVEITLSGCGVQGEGEHKIVQQIKNQQAEERKLRKPDQILPKPNYQLVKNSVFVEPKKGHFKLADGKPVDIGDLLGQQVDNVEDLIKDTKQVEVEIQKVAVPLQNDQSEAVFEMPLQSHCVFGMDGDLILLLLALNQPEVYCLRRWQGVMVHDVELPGQSKQDPWAIGLVNLDIAAAREALLGELLGDWFDNDEKLLQLALFVAPEQKEFLSEFKKSSFEGMEQVKCCGLYYQQIRELIIYSEVANRVVHDFVTLTLIVGNDFVPEVPGQSIRNKALDVLMDHYRRTYVEELPFSYLIDEDKNLNLKYISKMFTLIGDKCEPIQIKQDIKSLMELRGALRDDQGKHDTSGDWENLVNLEFGEVMEAVGEGIYDFVKSKKENPVTMGLVKQFYRKKYYNKFDQLKLSHFVQPPLGIDRNVQKKLAILDQYCNLSDAGEQIEPELQNFVDSDTDLSYFRGLHNLIRSYLQTIQWVIKYYLSPTGIPSWTWQYPYPFTPLCSDMAIYCQLYQTDQGVWNTVIQKKLADTKLFNEGETHERDIKVVLADQRNAELGRFKLADTEQAAKTVDVVEIQDLMEQLSGDDKFYSKYLINYSGPKFCFRLNSAKSSLMQVIYTLSRALYKTQLPEHILRVVPGEFFESQPTWQNVNVLDYESAFKSFNLRVDLTRHNSNFSQRFGMQRVDFGWFQNFSSFYKNYPLGLTDGVEFDQVEKYLEGVKFSQEEEQFNSAMYGRGANLVFTKSVGNQSMNMRKALRVVAGPGSKLSVSQERCKFDLDYRDGHVVPILKQLQKIQTLKSCFVLMEENSECGLQNVISQLYIAFSAPQVEKYPVVKQPEAPVYRGLRIYTETCSGFSGQTYKANVVTVEVNAVVGQVVYVNDTQVNDCKVSVKSGFLTKNATEIDKFLDNYAVFQSTPQPATPDMEAVARAAGLSIQQLISGYVVPYQSNRFGVVVGFVANKRIFVRQCSNGVLGQFTDQTVQLDNLVLKYQPKSGLDACQLLMNQETAFWELNQGCRVPNTAESLLIAQLSCIKDGCRTVSQKLQNLESWFGVMAKNTKLVKDDVYYRDQLVPFETFPVHCVPATMILRAYGRRQQLRALISDFAYQFTDLNDLVEQVWWPDFGISTEKKLVRFQHKRVDVEQVLAQHIESGSTIVSRKVVQQLLSQLPKYQIENGKAEVPEFTMNQELKSQLIAQNSTPGLDQINSLLSKFDQNLKLTQDVLYCLEGSVLIVGSDGAAREFGFNTRSSAVYDPQYYFGSGQFNGNFITAVLVFAASMPYIFVPLVKYLKGGYRGAIPFKELFTFHTSERAFINLSIMKMPQMRNGKFPVMQFEGKAFHNNVQMDSFLTRCSLYLHSYIIPLQSQVLVPHGMAHLPVLLYPELSRYVRQNQLEFENAEGEVQIQQQAAYFQVGDKVFVKRLEQFGVVIAANDEQVRVVVAKSGEKLSRNYQDFNVFQSVKNEFLGDQLVKLPGMDLQWVMRPCPGYKLPVLNRLKLKYGLGTADSRLVEDQDLVIEIEI